MGALLSSALRALAVGLQNPIARHQWLASRYLRFVGFVAKRLVDGKFKNQLVNVVRRTPWRDVQLPEQMVSVGSDVRIRIVPHAGEDDFDALFYRALSHEPEVFALLRPRMSQYDVVVEVGANVGIYTTFFSKALTEVDRGGHVFAFEPSQKAFLRLCQNLKSNDASNVSAFNCAVASTTGFAHFFEPEGHLTNGSLSRDFAALFADRVIQRSVMAVNGDVVNELVPVHRRILLKLDVEGAEGVVLRSLERFVLHRLPDVVLEVLPDVAADLNTLAFIPSSYRCFHITHGGLVEKDRFEGNSQFRDYLLVPRAAVDSPRSVPMIAEAITGIGH